MNGTSLNYLTSGVEVDVTENNLVAELERMSLNYLTSGVEVDRTPGKAAVAARAIQRL